MLLDSDILIYSARSEHAAARAFLDQPHLQVSAISQIEVLGFPKLTPADEVYLRGLFSTVQVLPMTTEIIERATILRRWHRLGVGDAIIAATALEHRIKLATRNVSHFCRVQGLEVINPFRETR